MAAISFDKILDSLNAGKRAEQLQLVEDIQQHGLTHHICGFNAATGIGKTLAYLSVAMQQTRPVVIAVPTHQLADQVLNTAHRINRVLADHGRRQRIIGQRKGRQEYLSPSRVKHAIDVLPNSDARDEVNLRNALLAAASSDNEGNLISEFLREYDQFPQGIARNDVCCDTDHVDSEYYIEQRQQESDCDVIVISHVLLLLPSGLNSLPPHLREGLLIIDEADALVATASSLFSKRISVSTLRRVAKQLNGSLIQSAMESLELALEDRKEGLTFFNAAPDLRRALVNAANALHRYQDAEAQLLATRIDELIDMGLENTGLAQSEGKHRFLHLSKFAARATKMRIDEFQFSWLLSGTLDITPHRKESMKWLAWQLGLEVGDIGFYSSYDPTDYGRITLSLVDHTFPNPTLPDGELNPAFVEACADVLQTLIDGHMLINTSSYQETWALADELRERLPHASLIADRPGQPLTAIIQQFQQQEGGDVVLITPRASTGVDIRKKTGGQLFHQMVITKVPFAPPPDVDELEYQQIGAARSPSELVAQAYLNGMQVSVRRLIQVLGRAIRAKKDRCDISIFDKRFPHHGQQTHHPLLSQVIPERFLAHYINAAIITTAKPAAGTGSKRQMVF